MLTRENKSRVKREKRERSACIGRKKVNAECKTNFCNVTIPHKACRTF